MELKMMEWCLFSWMDCLDLRYLTVLVNSTLSSSSYPELVYFHFFIVGGNEDKMSFYKLKPEEVKETMRSAFYGEQYVEPHYEEMVLFIIPSVLQFLTKFIYASANVIMKDACFPDLNVPVLDARRLDKDFVEVVLWWSKALNLRERT